MITKAVEKFGEETALNFLAQTEAHLRGLIYSAGYWEKIDQKEDFIKITKESFINAFFKQYEKDFGKIIADDKYKDTLEKIFYSFLNHESVLVIGPVGCGKTSILRTIANIFTIAKDPDYQSFGIAPATRIASELKIESIFKKYTNPIKGGILKNAGWIYDDIGTEEDSNIYGNKSNVIQEIVTILDNSHDMKGKFHFTSNLGYDQLKERYGERIISRLNGMCNVIIFDQNTQDFRQIEKPKS